MVNFGYEPGAFNVERSLLCSLCCLY